MDVYVGEGPAAKVVTSTEVVRAFKQILICAETAEGETVILSLAPLRAKWLMAQIEGAIINPDA